MLIYYDKYIRKNDIILDWCKYKKMEDSILYNLWLKTDDADAAFEKWKQEKFSNISVNLYNTQEWRDHVVDCDRRGRIINKK